MRKVRIEAPRGDIVDRHGTVLVKTRVAPVVQIVPSSLPDAVLAQADEFRNIFVITAGGPGTSTTVLAWLAYQTSFISLNFGLSNTYAYYIAAFTFGLAIVYIKALYTRERYNNETPTTALRHSLEPDRRSHRRPSGCPLFARSRRMASNHEHNARS